ncbi:MAG: hypothetical protein MUO76_11420 [Anaerolineaceae bacterium]|nr:hypothetical protein [Anaerolineaceae bacterium]
MKQKNSKRWVLLFTAILMISIIACSLIPGENIEQPTPTPTGEASEVPAAITPTSTPTTPAGSGLITPDSNRCEGLSGTIEVQVLAGPAEAVGLEPYAVGDIPFSVTSSETPYTISGAGPIVYEDVLVKDWGTYTVTMDVEISIEGECTPSEDNATLQLTLTMIGEQFVIVDAQGFYGEYPWAGTHTFDLNFPLEEGASVEGEGFAFVLHPN